MLIISINYNLCWYREYVWNVYLQIIVHQILRRTHRVDQITADQLPGGFALERILGIVERRVQRILGCRLAAIVSRKHLTNRRRLRNEQLLLLDIGSGECWARCSTAQDVFGGERRIAPGHRPEERHGARRGVRDGRSKKPEEAPRKTWYDLRMTVWQYIVCAKIQGNADYYLRGKLCEKLFRVFFVA